MTEQRIHLKKMGSAFELIVIERDAKRGKELLDLAITEIDRIESLFSEFREDSITSLLNKNAGKGPVEIPVEVFKLLQRSLHISRLCQGAFDITVGPLKKLYNFKNKVFRFPDKQQIEEALDKTGYEKILLPEPGKARLRKKEMKISFASIGKGYAADQVKKLWLTNGLQNGMISASGDLTVLGTRKGKPWQVGIAHPDDPSKSILHLPLYNNSIATSGDYEQFFMHKGIRYSHNINPEDRDAPPGHQKRQRHQPFCRIV